MLSNSGAGTARASAAGVLGCPTTPIEAFSMMVALAGVGCSGALPEPASAPQPDDAYIEVPYPPPAARVETLPKRPEASAVWIDGQWEWDGARWAWLPGAWVVPPPQGRFARWAVRLQRDGRLQFAPPSWRDASGRELPPARELAAAIGEAFHSTLPPLTP